MSIRHVAPVPRKSATGRVAEVYAQSTADFGQTALMMLSPAPELHAAAWAMLRESELAGFAPRSDKEVVAVAVSQANRCRFCIDAHTILIHALGHHQLAEDLFDDRVPADPHHAALASWAKGTRALDPAHLSAPPFPAELAAEYIGTALSTHFINRMFSTLTDERLLPGNLQRARSVRRVGAMAYTRTARQELTRGDSLPLLAGIPTAPSPAWAGDTPIGAAFAALRSTAADGATFLSEPSQNLLRATVAEPAAGPLPHGAWLTQRLTQLPEADRPAAKLALLAALEPHDITETDVAAWRTTTSATDADLVRLLSFGAITAVERIEEAITSRTPRR